MSAHGEFLVYVPTRKDCIAINTFEKLSAYDRQLVREFIETLAATPMKAAPKKPRSIQRGGAR